MLSNCGAEGVPWTAERSNQSILKEIIPEYSLEGLMLKLKLQYFSYLMHRTDSLEKILILGRLKAGGEGGKRGWDGWMASSTWTWAWTSSRSWWWTGKPGLLQFKRSQRVGHDWVTELTDCVSWKWICFSITKSGWKVSLKWSVKCLISFFSESKLK